MAGLSFMESFALGYMAAGTGPDWGATLSGIQTDLRYKQALAQADADYTALVNDYNRLVDGINELCRLGVNLEAQVASQNKRIAHQDQTIAFAIQGAAELEQRLAAAEQRAADLAQREAEARRDADFYKERDSSATDVITKYATELNKAKKEITRLEAIIAGMTQAPNQDSPTPNGSVP